MMLPLRLQEVSFLHIIKPLSLDIEAGPSTVIVGANGAGKSVLMRLMHGLLLPTSGMVSWGAPGRQAMVFQRPVMLRRSALGNVAYALRVAGRDESPAMEALEEVGLAHVAHRAARVRSRAPGRCIRRCCSWTSRPQAWTRARPARSRP